MLTFKTKDGENFFAVYWLYLAAGAVLAASFAGLFLYPETGKWHGVLEAVFIAAALTLTVDPFVKTRLAREVNKNIFYHVLGFRLPEEMQDRLRVYLRDLKYYRECLSVTVKALKIEGDEVLVEVESESKIIALTKCNYSPSLAFEEVEQGQVIEMWAKRDGSENKLIEWKAGDPSATTTPEPMTTLHKTASAKLHRGDVLHSCFKYTLRGRKKDYWVQTFGTTTLKTMVTLVPLAQMEMSASDPAARKPDNQHEYVYDKVFIVGEDIHIRWKVTG